MKSRLKEKCSRKKHVMKTIIRSCLVKETLLNDSMGGFERALCIDNSSVIVKEQYDIVILKL